MKPPTQSMSITVSTEADEDFIAALADEMMGN